MNYQPAQGPFISWTCSHVLSLLSSIVRNTWVCRLDLDGD